MIIYFVHHLVITTAAVRCSFPDKCRAIEDLNNMLHCVCTLCSNLKWPQIGMGEPLHYIFRHDMLIDKDSCIWSYQPKGVSTKFLTGALMNMVYDGRIFKNKLLIKIYLDFFQAPYC